jgi:MFS family permease
MPDWGRYGAVGVLVAACILPFAWRLHGHAARPRCREVPVADQSRLRPRRRPNSPILPRPASDEAKHRPFTRPVWQNFVLVWVSRMFVVTTLGITQGYMLLFLRQRGTACPLPIPPEAMIAQMTAIATACNVACGLLGGALSDRIGYRKPFVLAFLQGCAGLRGAAALYGAGNGLYSTVDLALMVQILPSIVRAGQYLGIMNLANTVAQVIAPLLALQVLAGNTPDYRMLFCMAATMSLLGAVCILGVMSRSGLAAELRIATGEQPTDLVE